MALLMRRPSEHGTRDCDKIPFWTGFESDLSQNLIKKMKLMKLR